MRAFKNENDNYQYILTVIDVFSKKAWAFKLKDKKGSSVLEALKILFEVEKTKKIHADQGSEDTRVVKNI